jgi:hypothetical protein
VKVAQRISPVTRQVVPCGTGSSSTVTVMTIAGTPSLNASIRPVDMDPTRAAPGATPPRRTAAQMPIW